MGWKPMSDLIVQMKDTRIKEDVENRNYEQEQKEDST